MAQSKIVSVKLEDGTIMHIEATRIGDTEEEISIGDKVFQFKGTASKITAISREIIDSVKKIGLSKAIIRFGLEIGVDAGGLTALLVKGAAKANLEITLEWNNQ